MLGRQPEASDDSRCDNTTSSTVLASIDESLLEGERTNMQKSSNSTQASKAGGGALELLGLLRILGEGYRLSCMYRCQVYKCDCWKEIKKVKSFFFLLIYSMLN